MNWSERPQPMMATEGDVVWRRAGAVVADFVLVSLVTAFIGGMLAEAGFETIESLNGLFISISGGYYIYLEGKYGQTYGKMMLDIVVVTEDGNPVDYRTAAIRTVLRIIDVLPFIYLVGYIVIYVTDRKQRLGDIAANTVVVRTIPNRP